MSVLIFFIAAIGTIAGAIGVIALQNPFYSVLALVGHLLSLAALFLLLRAEFVASAQVVVYAGAVMVLYIFVVSYVGDEALAARPVARAAPARSPRSPAAPRWSIELFIAVLGTGLKAVGTDGAPYAAGFGTPGQIGTLLLTQLPRAVRDRLLPAARRRGRRRRCSRAGAARPRRRRRGRHAAISVAELLAAAARGHRARCTRPAAPSRSVEPMSIAWYLAVSALIFAIGAGGVLIRRNPLVILLCLELMLNAANLALIGFSRMWGNGDGQIFALIVMVVAACEVTVGLGLIVAMHRRRLPIDVDEMRELQG